MYNIGIHAPITLLVDTQQLAGGFPPTYAPALVGNAVIIGDVGLTPGGCGFSNSTPVYNSQIETLSNGANMLYPNSCTPYGLQDGVTYQYIIHANINGWISYSISGGMTFGSPSINTLPDRPSGSAGTLSGGGLFFGLAPAGNQQTVRAMYFTNAATGWF